MTNGFVLATDPMLPPHGLEGAVYVSQTLRFLGPVKIGDVVDVSVEVVELTEKGRRVRLHCECRVGDLVVLDGEGVLSVPPTPKPKPPAA